MIGGGRFVLIGGLDAADTSSAEIDVAGSHGLLHSATLPLAQHDAQGAALAGKVYVFGGGSFSELDHIVSFDPVSNAVGNAGTLPRAQSDVAVTQLDGTAYIVGGYDGTNWLNTILAWRPGSGVRVAGHLPVGLRYSSVSPVDGRLVIIGGSTPAGATDAIYSFDPASGRVAQDRAAAASDHPCRRGDAGLVRVPGRGAGGQPGHPDGERVVDRSAHRGGARRRAASAAAVGYRCAGDG